MHSTENLVGAFGILAVLPIWQTAFIVYVTCISILYAGRDFFEGLPYNVALSSNYGDVALVGIIMIGMSVLQSGVPVPVWLGSRYFQLASLLVAIIAGIVFRRMSTSSQVMDMYHDLFILPFFVFLLILLILLIITQGSWTERIAMLALLAFWAGLVVLDAKLERLDQQAWLRKKGFSSPAWRKSGK